jgi:hypothetical protein
VCHITLPVDAPQTMQQLYDRSLAGTSFALTMLASPARWR